MKNFNIKNKDNKISPRKRKFPQEGSEGLGTLNMGNLNLNMGNLNLNMGNLNIKVL